MNEIPAIGFGTWKIPDGQEARDAVVAAIDAGYRLIDTAKIYGNEQGVGQGIAASDVDRNQIYVTTKLWNADQGFDTARRAFAESLKKLNLEYIDLYLIHWPGNDADLRRDSWQALLQLHDQDLARAIGVSNYEVNHLEELLDYSPVPPAVNQIEFHPFVYVQQKPILDFCNQHGIIVEAYSPLAHRGNIKNPVLDEVAKAHSKTHAQVMLRWCIQHGTVPIPKSSKPERIAENIDVFDFELLDQEMERINSLSNARNIL